MIPSINVDNGRSSMVNSIPEATRVVIGAVVLTVLASKIFCLFFFFFAFNVCLFSYYNSCW